MKTRKLENIRNQANADCILLINSINWNFSYITGLSKHRYKKGIALVENGKITLLINPLEKKPSKKFDYKIFKKKTDVEEFLSKKLKNKTIGLDFSGITEKTYKKLDKFSNKCVDISKILEKERAIKNKEEIKRIGEACKISEDVFDYVKENIDFGMKEGDVKKIIKKGFIDKDVIPAFKPIVANEKNSSIPHYNGNDRIGNEQLLIDLGCIYKNYCSDISRMFTFKQTEKQGKMYNKLIKTRDELVKSMGIGKKISEIQKKANKLLGGEMVHPVIHGVGLNVHDYPRDKNRKIKENMVFALEPSIYTKNMGMRIEDLMVVKKEKNKMLSKAPAKISGLP